MVNFLAGAFNVAVLTTDSLAQDKSFKHNFVVNVFDGGFFGFGMGFGSIVTVVPLFISLMTDSAILIGLIPAIHVVGWQLPQLFTARHVARQTRYKPMVMLRTIQERVPFLGLAVIAWFLPKIGPQIALGLSFGMLVWQGLGGGFAATAWQSMVGKIIPGDRWGLFFGFQSAAASLFASISAVLAGIILERVASPVNYTICFLLTSAAMAISWIFLDQTREEKSTIVRVDEDSSARYWSSLRQILRKDTNFRWFVLVRILAQLGTVGFSFYTVYAVRYYGIGGGTAGVLTAVLTIMQTAFNPVMGWLGDRWSHRGVMGLGLLAAIASTTLAWLSPGVGWFYLVFGLAGIANVAVWTIAMAMTLEYGTETERPAYIGLANTLVAPSAFLIPLIGGWLADTAGYQTTFITSAIGGIITFAVLIFFLKDQTKTPHGIIAEQQS
jgi:MFS family permease